MECDVFQRNLYRPYDYNNVYSSCLSYTSFVRSYIAVYNINIYIIYKQINILNNI